MFAFVVFVSVIQYKPRDWLGRNEMTYDLRNDLFCVGWDVKP